MTTRRTVWPEHLRPGEIRFARASRRYEATVAFYRDLVGLPFIEEFTGSFGEDGTILGLPDTSVQLEIVRTTEVVIPGFDQLVLYLDSPASVLAATAQLRAAGVPLARQLHPYWAANGAVAYTDPDGRDVVFAPWIFGRDLEPAHHGEQGTAHDVSIGWYTGDREALRALFAEAEDSASQLDSYLGMGRVLVAARGPDLIGHLQLVPADDVSVELKNMAVAPAFRGRGIGRRLVEAALLASASEGATRMLVATAAADIGNLRFYQRCGFRFLAFERDAFTADAGYEEAVVIDGIPLRDRVWLDQPVGTDVTPHAGA